MPAYSIHDSRSLAWRATPTCQSLPSASRGAAQGELNLHALPAIWGLRPDKRLLRPHHRDL